MLVKETMISGEPIVRMMEYNYPNKQYGRIADQFMLGKDILVCPVIRQGAIVRKVILPEGKWEYCDGTVYMGECELEIPADISVLPYFRRIQN